MPKDIGKTLKECRTSAKMSVREISDLLTLEGYKASESTIYSWENGNSQPTPGALLTMCKAYGMEDVLSVFGYDGYKDDGSLMLDMCEINIIEKYRSLDQCGHEAVSYTLDRESERVRLLLEKDKLITEKDERIAELESKPTNIIEFGQYSEKVDVPERLIASYYSTSAGTGVFIMGNEVVDKIPIPDTLENRNVDYAIKVSGDSMEPEFHDGDTALVSQKSELSHGDIGIFIINGNAYIKEYGEKELISHNPESDNINISEYDNIVCMGKVVGKL